MYLSASGGSLRFLAKLPCTPFVDGSAKCLIQAQQLPDFRYFFQHGIANKLKERDPEALAAVAMLARS
jgi:hypothetical protein